MRLSVLLLSSLSSLSWFRVATAGAATTSSSARLPGALSSVTKELPDTVKENLKTATVIFSRSARIVHGGSLLDSADPSSVTAVGRSDSGLVLASPSSVEDVLNSVKSTQGRIACVVRDVDLERGEGVVEGGLVPAAAAAAAVRGGRGRLLVLLETTDLNGARTAFQRAVDAADLEKAFSSIEYVAFDKDDDLAALVTANLDFAADDEDDDGFVPTSTSFGSAPSSSSSSSSARDVAASARLRPARDAAVEAAVGRVTDVARPDGEEEDILIPAFGALVNAAVDRALQEFDAVVAASSPRVRASPSVKRLRAELLENVADRLRDPLERQRGLLSTAVLEDFRKGLSKLKISPTLPKDADDEVDKAAADLAKRLKGLETARFAVEPERASAPFRRNVRDVASGLLAKARVSGNFRPVPRKGVSVGLHWLLPKPFGNDYRQNPTDVTKGSRIYYDKEGVDETTTTTPMGERDWRRAVAPVPGAAGMTFENSGD